MTQIEVGHGHLHMEGNIRNGEESPTMTFPLFVPNPFVLVVRGGGQFYQDLSLLLHQALPQCHPLHLGPHIPTLSSSEPTLDSTLVTGAGTSANHILQAP